MVHTANVIKVNVNVTLDGRAINVINSPVMIDALNMGNVETVHVYVLGDGMVNTVHFVSNNAILSTYILHTIDYNKGYVYDFVMFFSFSRAHCRLSYKFVSYDIESETLNFILHIYRFYYE